MRLIEGRAAMRWFPSRYNFALFRLFAFLRLRSATLDGPRDRIFFIDRHQSRESYIVGLWIVITMTCYFASMMQSRITLPIALLIALPLAFCTVQVLTVGCGLTVAPLVRFLARKPGQNNIRINSTAIMTMLTAVAAYFAMQRTWVRFAAWQFLALIALNAVAAALVSLLGGEISRLENLVGGESSEPSSLRSR